MKKSLIGLFIIILCVQWSFAQKFTAEQEVINLSKDKWQWMADKNVDKLTTLLVSWRFLFPKWFGKKPTSKN